MGRSINIPGKICQCPSHNGIGRIVIGLQYHGGFNNSAVFVFA
jgi:hypothetical protein